MRCMTGCRPRWSPRIPPGPSFWSSPVVAVQLLVSWSYCGRVCNQAAFAALAGVAPIKANNGLRVWGTVSTGAGTSTEPCTPLPSRDRRLPSASHPGGQVPPRHPLRTQAQPRPTALPAHPGAHCPLTLGASNGLLRQYFPKGTDLANHTQAHLDAVAVQVNVRPCMNLDWRAPAEVLDNFLRQSLCLDVLTRLKPPVADLSRPPRDVGDAGQAHRNPTHLQQDRTI